MCRRRRRRRGVRPLFLLFLARRRGCVDGPLFRPARCRRRRRCGEGGTTLRRVLVVVVATAIAVVIVVSLELRRDPLDHVQCTLLHERRRQMGGHVVVNSSPWLARV